jgi:CHAD domain-containing protein
MDVRLGKLRSTASLLAQMLDDIANSHDAEPAEKAVHRLRTSTRRCGALLGSLTAEGRPSRSLEELRKNADRLQRQWKKLRGAAGRVRDLDVHREIVDALRKEPPPPETPRANAPFTTLDPRVTMDPLWTHLDAWLEKARRQHAAELHSEAARRGPKTVALSHDIISALTLRFGRPTNSRRASKSPALLALDDFAAVSSEMPVLDRDNLHDFRKRTKEARYLAEAGGDSPEAVTVARALKRIQDEIGDWHDRDALAQEAAEALGKHGRPLTEHLQDLAAKQMQRAILITERMRGRLLGERQALRHARPRSQPQHAESPLATGPATPQHAESPLATGPATPAKSA